MILKMPQPFEPGVSFQKCVAVYDNIAECEDELAFRAGDVLTIIEKETGGLHGWWLCSLRGRQGICPGNRLRLLGVEEEISQRRSWPNKVVMPQKFGDVYLYDSPRMQGTISQVYDVPPPGGGDVVVGECYDVPRPPGSPSSSVSSLATTDSNRSSLIQDYDVPRAATRTLQYQAQLYDVPRDGGSVTCHGTLSLGEALDRLGKVEAEALGALRGVVGEVGPSATAPPHRLPHLRMALDNLRPSLRRLSTFAQHVLALSTQSGLEPKLSPLVSAIANAERIVEEGGQVLDQASWDPQLGAGPLASIIAAATPLTDDIRQLASFIQGNSTLLFKKNGSRPEQYDYVNLEKDQRQELDEVDHSLQQKNGSQTEDYDNLEKVQREVEEMDPVQRQWAVFWARECRGTVERLSEAIGALLMSVQRNQPPAEFVRKARVVVVAGHEVLAVGAAAGHPSPTLQSALSQAVDKASLAANKFPSVSAVQAMVDSVTSVSHAAALLDHSLATAAAGGP